MNKTIIFDVLIVYTESLAMSATSGVEVAETPFLKGSKSESYNNVYLYFLELCRRSGLRAALATSADVVGAGRCSSYWTVKNRKWLKNSGMGFSSLIFDKFSPTKRGIRASRELLFSSKTVRPFNDPELFEMFFDKLKTFEELSLFSIPTVALKKRNLEGMEETCRELKRLVDGHPKPEDFKEDMVMKDRFGAGGRHVYKFKVGNEEKMLKIMKRHPRVSFIVQPFVKFDKGFSYLDNLASTDVRLVFLGGNIVQSYIRVAKPTDFRCNEHQGGSLVYISTKEIPKKIVAMAYRIISHLNKSSSFYALDFIMSNSRNVYLLEGNTGPGLDWNELLKKNTWEAKKLIRLVVKELVIRVGEGGESSYGEDQSFGLATEFLEQVRPLVV